MNLNSKILESRDRADRMLVAARIKAAAANTSPAPMIGDPGVFYGSSGTGASRQYSHLRGHQYTAISAIAKRVAGQRIFVAREMNGPRGTKSTIGDDLEPLLSHPFLDAIAAPNPVMVQWSLLWSTVASLNATGRAYWLFAEDFAESGWDIWPIPSHCIEPADPWRKNYKIRLFDHGEPRTIDGRFVAPFILPDPSDPLGSISPMQAQSLAIDADEAIQKSQVASFSNGGKPGMVLRVGRLPPAPGMAGQGERPHLTPEQRTQLINAIRRAYRGAEMHGEPLILDGMIEDAKPYSHSPAEMDWKESGKQTKGRIFESFGVHPFITGEQAPGSYAQMAAVERLFCSQVINPLLSLISQTLTRWAAPLFAAPDETLKIWIEEATADDPELRLRKWQYAAARNMITTNEFRRAVLNLPDIAGGDELPDAPPAASPAAAKAVADILRDRNPYSLAPLDRLKPSTNGHHG